MKLHVQFVPLALLSLLACSAAFPTKSSAALLGPSEYLCFDDSAIAGCGGKESPFAHSTYSYFHLENFEDHLFNSPGVSASGGSTFRLSNCSVFSNQQDGLFNDGASFIVFGPVYDTPSKRGYGPPQGLAALHRIAAVADRPVIAIGGITPARVGEVLGAGAAGVAVISAILGVDRPADATKAFLDALGTA